MILITEIMDAPAVESLADLGVEYAPELVEDQPAIPARLAGKRALIVRNRTQVTASMLAAAPGLVCVGRLGVGLDNIDMAACAARGVEVYPALGANARSVAEYVVTTTAMLLRGAYAANADVIAGAWPRNRLMGRETAGKTLGLLGFGAIARVTAELARAFGMRVIAHDPFVPEDDPVWARAEVVPVTLERLFAGSDALSLQVPLTEATLNIIDARALAVMKPGAVLINAARGGVVDEAALVEALRAGRPGGAALDTFAQEPVSAAAGAALADVPNLILTPHIAGVTQEANERVSTLIAAKVRARLAQP
ncbi:MAG: hydroxyacid dehydrogenase [Pseudomonadota bacterium]